MSIRIYVENLPAATTAADLINLFAPYGNVVDVNVAADRNNLQPLGFGFVTMVTPEGARAAIQGLHGKQMATRKLIVTEVRAPSPAPADTHAPPKPSGHYHPLLPILKKNGILPTAPSHDDGAAK
jgi:RNA recognition motif-containing protein